MDKYICPRCMGTDIYFTKRQKLQEQGFRLGAKVVNTPVCRNCGEVADEVIPETAKGPKGWRNERAWFGFFLDILHYWTCIQFL